MAELSTLARPYARAAFEYARDQGALRQWSAQLALAAAVSADPALEVALHNPALTAAQQAKTLIDVCGDEIGDKLRNYLSILADNKRLPLLPVISVLFEQYKASQEQSVDVEVVTPFELNEATITRLKDVLSKRLQREVIMATTTDRELLGGLLIRAGDTVIDGSVRGRLNRLAEAMNS
jgi:F-type H+-transporting ATPase subunit delta